MSRVAITLHPSFKKFYKKRIFPNKNLVKRFEKRIDLFREDPNSPILKDHPLKGDKEGMRSFSIAGVIRVIYYYMSDNEVLFLDVGSHNQVH